MVFAASARCCAVLLMLPCCSVDVALWRIFTALWRVK